MDLTTVLFLKINSYVRGICIKSKNNEKGKSEASSYVERYRCHGPKSIYKKFVIFKLKQILPIIARFVCVTLKKVIKRLIKEQ